MVIKLIVAVDSNWGIGYKGELLFRIKEDMKRFRKLTEGHYVLMGRKTYESLPKALEGRRNVVVTRNKNYDPKNFRVLVESDINKILNYYLKSGEQEMDLWVIGGTEIYKAFINYTDEVFVTRVNKAVEKVDAWFPYEGLSEFVVVGAEKRWSEEEGCEFSFVKYERNEENSEIKNGLGENG